MYSKIFDGRKIKISNRHHKLLLRRFDSNRFGPRTVCNSSESALMRNGEPCSLCKSYFKGKRLVPHCGECPLRMFETEDSSHGHYSGCSYILDQLMPTRCIGIDAGGVLYWCRDSDMALRELKVLTDFLKSFKKE